MNRRIICAKCAALGGNFQVIGWVHIVLGNRSFHVRIDDVIFDGAAVPSGIPRGSVIGPLLVLVMANDLPRDLQIFCLMFAEGTKLGGVNVPSIQLNLDKTAE